MPTTSEILDRYENSGVRLHMKVIVNNDQSFVLIEGDSVSLKFVGELLVAQAEHADFCNLHLHPDGTGLTWFAEGSSIGLYAHLLPCDTPLG